MTVIGVLGVSAGARIRKRLSLLTSKVSNTPPPVRLSNRGWGSPASNLSTLAGLMATAIIFRLAPTKNSSFPSRLHTGHVPPFVETFHFPAAPADAPDSGTANVCTYISYRPVSYEAYDSHFPFCE